MPDYYDGPSVVIGGGGWHGHPHVHGHWQHRKRDPGSHHRGSQSGALSFDSLLSLFFLFARKRSKTVAPHNHEFHTGM
jgi:hypothetical protein